MRGKTDGRDASPTVRVRFQLPVGDVRETAGRGRAGGFSDQRGCRRRGSVRSESHQLAVEGTGGDGGAGRVPGGRRGKALDSRQH